VDTETLTFARSCLLNSLTVLNSPDCSYCPSNLPSETEQCKFKISLFTALAYVSLSLSDYSPAYNYAKHALNLDPKGYQRVLANLYAGEALVFLDQYNDAITHFSPEHATVEPPTGEDPAPVLPEDVSNWFPETAKTVLLYNLAATLSLRGDNDRASEILRQLSSNVPKTAVMPIHALMLTLYLNLQLGTVDVAKSLIRQQLR